MKNGRFTVDQIRPHQGISEEGLMDHLTDLKTWTDQASSWKEWEATPEIFPVGNQVHIPDFRSTKLGLHGGLGIQRRQAGIQRAGDHE